MLMPFYGHQGRIGEPTRFLSFSLPPTIVSWRLCLQWGRYLPLPRQPHPQAQASSLARMRALRRRGFRDGFTAGSASAAGLNDLMNQQDLTPEGLARVWRISVLKWRPRCKPRKFFFQRKRGDCADFANLASVVLRPITVTRPSWSMLMMARNKPTSFVKSRSRRQAGL